MPLAVKKKQDRTISRCGNSTVLYLPTGYFIPGETVNLKLEIDFDGNLKLTLKKCLFNFNLDKIKTTLKKGFNVGQDEILDGTQSFTATNGNLSVTCTGYINELEPTYVTTIRLFENVNSTETYTALTGFLENLRQNCPNAYIEPEGNIDCVKIYKNPEKYELDSELQAVELLRKKGKVLHYAVIARFNSKRHTLDDVMQALNLLGQSDEVLLKSV